MYSLYKELLKVTFKDLEPKNVTNIQVLYYIERKRCKSINVAGNNN
jgi:hypothetical protein